MAHQYKRRTWDEARELARLAFRSTVAAHLTAAEIQEIQEHGALTGGTVGEGWEEILGHPPDDRGYYEVELYRPSDACPYVEKIFARMLVPRDRSSDTVYFLWRPPFHRSRSLISHDHPTLLRRTRSPAGRWRALGRRSRPA